MTSPLLPDSLVVNGQLLGVKQSDAYNPITYGPWYQGGATPVPSAGPAQLGMAVMPSDNSSVSGNTQQVANAAASPWSPSQSPLIWVIAALIVGLLGLRYVHWG